MSDFRVCDMLNTPVPFGTRSVTVNFTLVPGVYSFDGILRPGETIDWINPVTTCTTDDMCTASSVSWTLRPAIDTLIQTVDIFYRASHQVSVVLNKLDGSVTIHGIPNPGLCFMVQLSINLPK